MSENARTHPHERVATIAWIAGLGAVTADALARRDAITLSSARGRLQGGVRAGLLMRGRPLADEAALYAVTRAGLRACGARGLEPCRVSAASAAHAIAASRAAAVLERAYPARRIIGERELRRDERERGRPLASAALGHGPRGELQLHRPDLVMWPEPASRELPVAIEVELTAKAPARLAAICRAWARCRLLGGVVYLVAPDAQRALERAVLTARAQGKIALVPLDVLAGGPPGSQRAAGERTVPSGA